MIATQTPSIDWLAIAPVIALVGAALAVILVRAMIRHAPRVYEASIVVGFVGLTVAALFLARQWSEVRDSGSYLAISDMVAVDGFAVFVGTVVLIATGLVLLLSSKYLARRGIESRPEYVALLLLSAAGMLVMSTANDLIVVFVALETLSIPLYVLSAYDRRRSRSLEAGMKYFVLGAFASAVLLYGIALVYGATGTTSLLGSEGNVGIAQFLSQVTLLEEGTLIAGLMLLLVGLGFKIAAVPFHMWTPDVYEGSPTPVTAFMASATKAAGFAALLRILLTAFVDYRSDWRPAIWGLAVLTLVVGSVAALVQRDIKRMLAYSSISHAGYVLIGLEAGTRQGLEAALFYLLVYAFMTVGSFAVVSVVGRRDDRHLIEDYRALGRDRPALAALLAFFLLAQAGVPPTGGFIAKLGVFAAAADARSYALLLVGVVASVIAAFFYLRVIVVMYASEDVEEATEAPAAARARVDAPTAVVLAVCAAFTLWVGILPTVTLEFARHAHLVN
ncbi:MAG: NADH-quinone oxidoreductase subunit N [Actinobacteria bacterium]|nr:NADH-quinone oxidoreductase subunit N [Actinomycetota bacterium]